MRKWGLVVTLLYLVIVLVLLVPATLVLLSDQGILATLGHTPEAYRNGITWVNTGFLVIAQALLMLLTVDTSQRRLKPRTHILVSATTTGVLLALLTFAVLFSAMVVRWGDNADKKLSGVVLAAIFLGSWAVWGVVFYRMTRDADDAITRAVSWLMRGSILELLIAVPSHVIVRRRHDCSAPIATGFGISTGIAIMLLSFGPSVLLLYKKRMESLNSKGAAAAK